MTFKKALDQWVEWLDLIGSEASTISSYSQPLYKFCDQNRMGSTTVDQIDEFHLNKMINPKDDTCLATRRRKLAGVKSFFKYCNGKGWCGGDPSLLVRVKTKGLSFRQKEPQVKEPFTMEELGLVYRYFTDYLKTAERRRVNQPRIDMASFWLKACDISYWTGLRMGDIICMEWDSVQGEELVVWTDKRDKRIAIDMTSPHCGGGILVEIFKGIKRADDRFIFPRFRNRYVKQGHTYFSRNFTRWVRLAKVPRKTFHCLRHTFVSRLAEEGVSMEQISRIVGHSNVVTTEGYRHDR